MAPPIKSHCKRGHEYTPKNTILSKLSNGYIVRKCRRCVALSRSARYHTDAAYQAAVRHNTRNRYHDR